MEIIALKDKDWDFGLTASPVLQTAKLLQRISYAIKRPFYSGADTVAPAIIRMERKPAIKAYSMDVAPDWSQRKYWDFFIMPEVSALLPKDSIKDRLVMPIKF